MTTRSDLPRRLGGLLRAPANVAVHGTPGSGKSWVAARTVEYLRDEGIDTVRIDLSTVMSGKEVFTQLARISEHGEIVLDTHGAWKRARAEFERRTALLVVILDQFDRVLQFDDAQEFLLLLRELVHPCCQRNSPGVCLQGGPTLPQSTGVHSKVCAGPGRQQYRS